MAMKTIIKRKKMIFGSILVLFFVFSIVGYAQDEEAGNTEQSPTQNLTVDQALELRKKILDVFGIPSNTPLSLLDIWNAKTLGITLSPTGPLHDLRIVINNDSPKTGDNIRAAVAAIGVNLNASTITWYHGGKKELSGKGEVVYEFTVGPLGTDDSLRAVVTTPEGITREAILAIYPSKIHLTWSASGYTPGWYRGKALPLSGSKIVFVAIPDVRIGKTRLLPQNLTYRWRVDGYTAEGGRGKNSFELRTSNVPGVSYVIKVEVDDDSGNAHYNETFRVRTFDLLPLFYEKDALLGVKSERAVKDLSIQSGGNVALQVEPLYLPKDDLPYTNYQWKVNGKAVSGTDPTSRIFRLTAEPGSSGDQRVDVRLESTGHAHRVSTIHAIIKIPEQK